MVETKIAPEDFRSYVKMPEFNTGFFPFAGIRKIMNIVMPVIRSAETQ